jgi:hypothetical protein
MNMEGLYQAMVNTYAAYIEARQKRETVRKECPGSWESSQAQGTCEEAMTAYFIARRDYLDAGGMVTPT